MVFRAFSRGLHLEVYFRKLALIVFRRPSNRETGNTSCVCLRRDRITCERVCESERPQYAVCINRRESTSHATAMRKKHTIEKSNMHFAVRVQELVASDRTR